MFNYSRRSSQVDTPGAVGFSYFKNINYREQVSHMIYRISRLWNMTVKKTLSLCAAEIKTCFLKLINMNFRTVATMFSRTKHVSNAHAMRRKEVIAMRVRQTTFICILLGCEIYLSRAFSSLVFEQKQNMSCNNHVMCYARNESAR